jgi:hypothetical protein
MEEIKSLLSYFEKEESLFVETLAYPKFLELKRDIDSIPKGTYQILEMEDNSFTCHFGHHSFFRIIGLNQNLFIIKELSDQPVLTSFPEFVIISRLLNSNDKLEKLLQNIIDNRGIISFCYINPYVEEYLFS